MPKKKSDTDLFRERDKAREEVKSKESLLEEALVHTTNLKEQLSEAIKKRANTTEDLELLKEDAQRMRAYIIERDEEFRYGRKINRELSRELDLLRGKRFSLRYHVIEIVSYLWIRSKEVILNLWQKTKEFIAR